MLILKTDRNKLSVPRFRIYRDYKLSIALLATSGHHR